MNTTTSPVSGASHIFISHANADDGFVQQLRAALESHHLPVWVDSRNLRGGSILKREVEQAIESARQTIVVLSPNTVNSRWVRREVEKALDVEKGRAADGYAVIPILLPGLAPTALENWFDEEPIAISIQLGSGGLVDAMPHILAALEERLPTDHATADSIDAKALEELVLALSDPKIEAHDGKRRLTASAALTYEPAIIGARRIESKRFTFTSPLGPIEIHELRWYLEQYWLWPVGVFKSRAEGVERNLPQWGEDLFKAALGTAVANDALSAWQSGAADADRCFSVKVDSDLPEGTSAEAQLVAREAGVELLALPWELLRDSRGWLFQGRHPTRVRRCRPNRQPQPARHPTLPLRILLVSPRPEHDGKGRDIGYIDHRVSARPMIEAVEELGELVKLSFLVPPTYAALESALQVAADRNEPFDVVHFDGHGVYNNKLGLGELCFEDANDAEKLEKRAMESIDAIKLSGLFRQHRIPLVFLDACQSARAEVDPTASIAVRLLEEGVSSVVAMSHSVLVEAARQFVLAFYGELAHGARVGRAMLAGQRALYSNSLRGKIMGAGDLRLQDWFVPVIYQEQHDPQFITKIFAKEVRKLEKKKRELSIGALPEEPRHKFQGRSRELLALERLLDRQSWAVVRGGGGQGKTTLAAELARWLTRTGRFERAAFASLEKHRDARAVLDTIGQQLLPDGDKYSVAQFRDLKQALQHVERVLSDYPTIIVVDNCETVLESVAVGATRTIGSRASAESRFDPRPYVDSCQEIFSLCCRLLAADPQTRLVFTTREPLPAPFNQRGQERDLGALDRADAIELVSQVMAQEGMVPEANDPGGTPEEIVDLVEAVNCHPRALASLAREVARGGVKITTANLRALMVDLERKHPGDRENSLYASVELSMRRLSAESQGRIRMLAVCQAGIHLSTIAILARIEMDGARQLARELIHVGLAQDMGDDHLRLDPGLPPYLYGELTSTEVDALRERWADAMALLASDLYRLKSEDVQSVTRLTTLELPNLIGMLEWINDRWAPERIAVVGACAEKLIEKLGFAKALAIAVRVREKAMSKFKPGEWSHVHFVAGMASFDRLLDGGDFSGASAAAQQLLKSCLAVGETTYSEARYDTAMAYFLCGRALKRQGLVEAALQFLMEARRRLQELIDEGAVGIERDIGLVSSELGASFLTLGRISESAQHYEDAIRWARMHSDLQSVAVCELQLGHIECVRKRYHEAAALCTSARDAFEKMGSVKEAALAWHRIGIVNQAVGLFEAAERAYRQSLAIRVREDDLIGQSETLCQLGTLYSAANRHEEAAAFHREAAIIDAKLGNKKGEGEDRNNLGLNLLALQRYDEARQELQRAIACKKSFGHAALPWSTWANLEVLENIVGHTEDAISARQQAIHTYLAYRRDGGVSRSRHAEVFVHIANAIAQNQVGAARKWLARIASQPNLWRSLAAAIEKCECLLNGDRSCALAADPALHYMDAAELELLIENLSIS